MDKLQTMSEALIKYETIDEEQIKDIMAGRAPKPPAARLGRFCLTPTPRGPSARRPAPPLADRRRVSTRFQSPKGVRPPGRT